MKTTDRTDTVNTSHSRFFRQSFDIYSGTDRVSHISRNRITQVGGILKPHLLKIHNDIWVMSTLKIHIS